jgi:hypothetical protein
VGRPGNERTVGEGIVRGIDTSEQEDAITIHNPSFATTPLSPGKIKKPPPKLTNYTYTEFDQIDRNA